MRGIDFVPTIRLLAGAPHLDDAYLDAVEEVTRSQPTLPEPPWEQ